MPHRAPTGKSSINITKGKIETKPKKVIEFDYEEFVSWFDSIANYISRGRMKEEIPDGGGNICLLLDKRGNITESMNLWFGSETGLKPEYHKYIQVYGKIKESENHD